MSDAAADARTEIVIIRRRAADDGAPVKGGAWKIAYADFVTAMMAFFLVMWLINASNEATRAQVASYFNPIKLTDSSTGKKGLTVPKETLKSAEQKSAEGGEQQKQEEKLLAAPQETLNRIVANVSGGAAEPLSDGGSSAGAPAADAAAGIGDPFDPKSWDSVPEPKPAEASPPPVAPSSEAAPKPEEDKKHGPAQPADQPDRPVIADAKESPGEASKSLAADHRASTIRAEDAAEFEKEVLQRLGRPLDDLAPALDIRATGEGILISLTDKHLFGMFKTGSAEPEAQLIELVNAIAGVLNDHPGKIIIRGHTDSRPYKNKKYDNWQLSTARAHMAQYMLTRGGLDDARIHRVEGLADREPRVPGDPDAAENRRVDILLEARP